MFNALSFYYEVDEFVQKADTLDGNHGPTSALESSSLSAILFWITFLYALWEVFIGSVSSASARCNSCSVKFDARYRIKGSACSLFMLFICILSLFISVIFVSL